MRIPESQPRLRRCGVMGLVAQGGHRRPPCKPDFVEALGLLLDLRPIGGEDSGEQCPTYFHTLVRSLTEERSGG